MGVVRGVPVQPNVDDTGVDIPMTTLLDRAVTTVPQPPAPRARRARPADSRRSAIDLGAG